VLSPFHCWKALRIFGYLLPAFILLSLFMSYRDPYAAGGHGAAVDQYNRGAATEFYNPYQETHEPHRNYDQAGYGSYQGYRDEPFQPPVDGMNHSYQDTINAANSKETEHGSAAALAGGTSKRQVLSYLSYHSDM
jgi:hypothetical protein